MADLSQLSDDELRNQAGLSQMSDKDLTGAYNQLNAPTAEVPESSFRQPLESEIPKEIPGFMKAVDMIGSGAMKGSLEFTGRLLSFAEKGLTGTDYVQNAYDYWSKKEESDRAKYTGAGFLHGLGELPTEIATTAPLGGPLNVASKAATAIGKSLPYGLQKAVQYRQCPCREHSPRLCLLTISDS